MQIPNLREWRERRALTQEELAEQAGVSARSVAGYEAGAGARPGTVRKLAATLDVSVEDLLGKAEAPPSPEQPLLNGFEEERREDALDTALTAARRQAEQDRQAAARAFESERPQPYFKRHENEAVSHLLQHSKDELAGALIEIARRVVELEEQSQRTTETTTEQIAEKAQSDTA